MNNFGKTKLVTFIFTSLMFGWGLVHVQQDQDKKSPVIPEDNLPEIKLDAELPLGLTNPPAIPEETPLTDEVFALGRKLSLRSHPVRRRQSFLCQLPSTGAWLCQPGRQGHWSRRSNRETKCALVTQ